MIYLLYLNIINYIKVTGGAPAKLAKIGSIRKSIARVLTVTNQITKAKTRELFTGKFIPIDLREKKTRAIRRRLTPEQVKIYIIILIIISYYFNLYNIYHYFK